MVPHLTGHVVLLKEATFLQEGQSKMWHIWKYINKKIIILQVGVTGLQLPSNTKCT